MERQASFGPLLGMKALATAAVSGVLLLAVAEPPAGSEADHSADALLRRTARGWCARYGHEPGLQVASVEVRFLESPEQFSEGEGLVVAPVAVDVPGLQKVVDVDAYPPVLRRLPAEGILSLAWEYPGRSNRALRYLGLALVERPRRSPRQPSAQPSFVGLQADVREEALASVADLEEHNLERCAAFPDWARTTAGEPPHTEQLLRLARKLADQTVAWSEDHDLCAAIQNGRVSRHGAQVLAVMAARQVGVPAFAFATASPRPARLVGTYTDQEGWLFLDLERVGAGYFSGGDVLTTRVPIIGNFGASLESFWNPAGAAYAASSWSGLSSFSQTEWAREGAEPARNTTTTRSVPLVEACR